FMSLITELADDELFVSLAPVTKKGEKERAREELVTRFFAYGDGLEGYRDRPSEFLFNYVKNMNRRADEVIGLVDEYRKNFKSVMGFISKVFPMGFRKTANATTTPRARFEAISIGSKMALDVNP